MQETKTIKIKKALITYVEKEKFVYIVKIEYVGKKLDFLPDYIKGKPILAMEDESIRNSCVNLEIIHLPNHIERLNGVLGDIPTLKTVLLPKYLKKTYYSFFNNDLLDQIIFPKNCTIEEIGVNTFSYLKGLKKITIPKTVIKIDHNAFEGCNNLEEVIFEKGIQIDFIGERVFSDCNSLTEIIIPENTKYVDSFVFNNRKTIIDIYLEENNLRFWNEDWNSTNIPNNFQFQMSLRYFTKEQWIYDKVSSKPKII